MHFHKVSLKKSLIVHVICTICSVLLYTVVNCTLPTVNCTLHILLVYTIHCARTLPIVHVHYTHRTRTLHIVHVHYTSYTYTTHRKRTLCKLYTYTAYQTHCTLHTYNVHFELYLSSAYCALDILHCTQHTAYGM